MPVSVVELAPMQIRNLVFEALRGGDPFRAELIDTLVIELDWTEVHQAGNETAAMLEQLRVASERYEVGELSLVGYRDQCVALFFPTRVTRPGRGSSVQEAEA